MQDFQRIGAHRGLPIASRMLDVSGMPPVITKQSFGISNYTVCYEKAKVVILN